MLQSFASYTESSINAFRFNGKNQDVIARKQEIIHQVSKHHKKSPTSILFFGFSPFILGNPCQELFVTGINSNIKNFLDSQNLSYTHIDDDDLGQYAKSFDWVIASDEYFTFALTEEEQEENIKKTCNLAKSLVLTTLRDYKNQDFRDKEFSLPISVRSENGNKIFLEHHTHELYDKNAWNTVVHEITTSETKVSGPFPRRSMFFKQLAKFSIDSGASNFYVHKNLMYKSLIKKNYEHIISISF